MWHEYIDVSIYDNQYNNRQRLYIPGHRVWSGRVNLEKGRHSTIVIICSRKGDVFLFI